MGFQDFISESEATSIAGVSTATLNRFAEAGYIQVETDSDGLCLYCKSELQQVFGFQSFEETEAAKDTNGAAKTANQNTMTSSPSENGAADIGATSSEASTEERATSENASSFYSKPGDSSIAFTATKETKFVEADSTDKSKYSSSANDEKISLEDEIVEEDPIANEIDFTKKASATTQPQNVSSTVVNEQEREIFRLQKVSEMLEELLDSKQKELENARDERDWLRKRIEKLEEKADRDQLLLLSETQLVRSMIEERKKSPLRSALEWFGFVEPEKSLQIRSTIDAAGVKKPARPAGPQKNFQNAA